MPGNESVTDNMKSFVGGVALKQAFYNIKTYNAQAISTAITSHNADAAHRHLPAVPTTSPPTGTFSYLTNSQTPAWSTLPTSDAINSSSSSKLATSKAVSTLNTNLGTTTSRFGTLQFIKWGVITPAEVPAHSHVHFHIDLGQEYPLANHCIMVSPVSIQNVAWCYCTVHWGSDGQSASSLSKSRYATVFITNEYTGSSQICGSYWILFKTA